jgi:hypothetical protein
MTSDDDDILRDMTLTPGADVAPEPPRMVVGERHINAIEQELAERLILEIQTLSMPCIFIGANGELDEIRGEAEPWRMFFDGRIPAPWEAHRVKTELENLIVERYRDRIAIARELGPRATMADYVDACKREGIET